MSKVILLIVGIVVLGAVALSGIFSKPFPKVSETVGVPRPSAYILRKDIEFTLDEHEYPEYKRGDPNEKFLLAGADKDLTRKKPTMSQIGNVVIDGVSRQVWRCHVYDHYKGKELVYIYVMKDPDKFIMDVYLSEKYWDKLPHDGDVVVGDDDLIPIDSISIDLTINLHGEEKFYTVIKNGESYEKQIFTKDSVYSLNTNSILTNATIADLGSLDIYEIKKDVKNLSLYAIKSGTNILDGEDHEFYVLGRITGFGGKDNISRKSLQLRTVPFVKISKNQWWLPDCKPAIYLYPEHIQNVKVEVFPKGELSLTIPKYPKGGWQVLASPDGSIKADGQVYRYLYYEAKIEDDKIRIPDKGYVVKFNDLMAFYNKILPQLGLNREETEDFKAYWGEVLPYSPYYFIGIMDRESIDSIEPLSIYPNPMTLIRVRLYFKPLQKFMNVDSPEIKYPLRRNFTAVEWGGMVKTDKTHPFTCSQ